jgi:hypothetical protein
MSLVPEHDSGRALPSQFGRRYHCHRAALDALVAPLPPRSSGRTTTSPAPRHGG